MRLIKRKSKFLILILLFCISLSAQNNQIEEVKHLINIGEYNKANSFIEGTLLEVSKNHDLKTFLSLNYYKALINANKEEYINAIAISKETKSNLLEAININEIDKKELLIEINDLLIHCYLVLDKLNLANKTILENFTLLNKNQYLKKTQYLNYLAFIKNNDQDYGKAIIYIDQAQEYEKLYPSAMMTEQIANTKNLLGIISYQAKEYEKAVSYFNSSYDICIKNDIKTGKLKSLLNLCLVKYEMGKQQEAKALLLSMTQLKKNNIDTHLSEAHLILSKIAKDNNENQLAKKHIDTALVLARKIQSDEITSRVLIQKSILTDNLVEKNNIIHQIISLDNTITSIDIKLKIYTFIAKYYEEIDSTTIALKYQKLVSSISDSLNTKIKKLSVKTTSSGLNYLKTKKNLELIKAQNKLKKKKNTLYFIVITSLVIFLLIFIYNLKKIRKKEVEIDELKKEKLENSIIQKEKDMSSFAMHIDEKNKLLIEIKDRLKQIPAINKKIKPLISDMIIFINNDIELNKEKVQFYNKIDASKNSFISIINDKFSDLTDKEKKIASLVKLGLSSKQISLQLNITKASVDNYRTSLKKKMNVQKELKLFDFLQQL
jgi:DNA-binding CsgD family transcriptional regulator